MKNEENDMKYELGQQVNYWGRPHKVIRTGGGVMNHVGKALLRYDLIDLLNDVVREDVTELELDKEND